MTTSFLARLGIPYAIRDVPNDATAPPPPPTLQGMYELVINQRLQDLVTGTSPRGLPNANEGGGGGHTVQAGILKGRILVEVLAYRDITKPLPIIEAEKTAEEKEKEEEHKKHFLSLGGSRTLMLTITDGKQRMEAMEYERTPALDNTRLGAKFLLTDVYVIRGIVLLTPVNVMFVGAPTVQ